MSAQIDLLTGQAKTYYFFNPEDAIDGRPDGCDVEEWNDERLFVPGALVSEQASDNRDEARLQLPTGEIVTVSSIGLQRVDPQDTAGVADILLLGNFSEKSLLHTLRVRYEEVRRESRRASSIIGRIPADLLSCLPPCLPACLPAFRAPPPLSHPYELQPSPPKHLRTTRPARCTRGWVRS